MEAGFFAFFEINVLGDTTVELPFQFYYRFYLVFKVEEDSIFLNIVQNSQMTNLCRQEEWARYQPCISSFFLFVLTVFIFWRKLLKLLW